MIRSMTGYGTAISEDGQYRYTVEVRSLNNKYFKASIRVPEELAGLEPEIDSMLRVRLNRGTITLILKETALGEARGATIDQGVLDTYIEQLRASRWIEGGAVHLDTSSLLQLPGVIRTADEDDSPADRARGPVRALIEQACDALMKMRQSEGDRLAKDLADHLDRIAEHLEIIEANAPRAAREYEQRLRNRIDAMLADADVQTDPIELIREIAVYAEKTDIAEEVARLGGHVAQFRDILREPDDRGVGRTLEFLSQELLREANTIASKSNDAAISRAVVEIKGGIDRIREQVMNAE